MADKTIYDLGLHESTKIVSKLGTQSNVEYKVTRVPGGWLYSTVAQTGRAAVFVPYNDEFKKIQTPGEVFK
ncbi:hypothetical protein Q765_00320 [Flavobacterium rivuli WB 3.3-2 = DSM 21788]|uniref:Uncharacterized protein n=1 Tax=Flavobacterium rivuli WB 3.3-2 = DSM 21788 TaxID=1121895 RepID=A0A0A2M9S3_9FLAO|nr:hypothetical protein [Flavobacterium rivuli]KGO88396.1 hypothetical protein Q765_00320 [Flavobacterium rivuli WB 3.3-2 = DSM 21788]